MLASMRDYVALTKPSINRMCLLMTAGGFALAPGQIALGPAIWALIGTALTVGSANALNMWWERETDKLMKRTQDRPLAAGRLEQPRALVFGIAIGIVGLVVLALGTNGWTTALAAAALLSYVLVYTPLKYVSPLALFVGAIPGAIPPLLGWAAVTNTIDLAGLALFGTLLAWQMPHFIAIAIFREHDYRAAGIKTVPIVRGHRAAKWQALAWTVVLLPVSMALLPLGTAGWIYGGTALACGIGFGAVVVAGFWARSDARWAYRLFAASLVYLPVLVAGLVIDVALR